MAYVAVNEDGQEIIMELDPKRYSDFWDSVNGFLIDIPKGSIAKLIGRELTWEDEPVMLVETKEKFNMCVECACAKFADETIKIKGNK